VRKSRSGKGSTSKKIEGDAPKGRGVKVRNGEKRKRVSTGELKNGYEKTSEREKDNEGNQNKI